MKPRSASSRTQDTRMRSGKGARRPSGGRVRKILFWTRRSGRPMCDCSVVSGSERANARASSCVMSLDFLALISRAPRQLAHRVSTSTPSGTTFRYLCSACGCREVRPNCTSSPPAYPTPHRSSTRGTKAQLRLREAQKGNRTETKERSEKAATTRERGQSDRRSAGRGKCVGYACAYCLSDPPRRRPRAFTHRAGKARGERQVAGQLSISNIRRCPRSPEGGIVESA